MIDDLKKYFSEHAANPNFKSSNVARWYTELSNGQIAALQLKRTLYPETKASPRWYAFEPEFIIGKNTKVAKEFFNKNWKSKSWNKSTSKAGIEGLNWAKNILSELISSNSLGDGFIMIYGSNQKRLNAYKKMTRGVTGFYFHEDSNALVKEVKSDDIYTWELNNSKHIKIDEYKRIKNARTISSHNIEDKTDFSTIFSLLDKKKLNSRNVKSMFSFDSTKFNGISSVELLHTQTGQRVGNSLVRLLENANSNVYIQSLAKLNTDLQGKAFKERGYKNPKLAFSMLKEQLRNTKDNFNFDKRNFIGPMNLMKVQDKLGDISGFASTNEKLIGTSQDAMNFWKSKKVNTFFRRLGFKRHIISSKDLESDVPSTVAFEFPKSWNNKNASALIEGSEVKTFSNMKPIQNVSSMTVPTNSAINSLASSHISQMQSMENVPIKSVSGTRSIFNTGIKEATTVTNSAASNLVRGNSGINIARNKILSKVLK